MWLEADCNLISGESFIRQLLHGKRFIMEEFGKNSKILWLPDVFGYSASMPQMLNKSGIDSFVTSKISWNEYNAMPYETFIWQGIDGSEIFTQFILGAEYDAKLGDKDNHFSSYSGKICPNALAYSWEHYHQKNINNEILTTYGYGDGGGGVTEDMLETYRRIEKGIPGTPNARISSATDCIKRIKKNIIGKKIPKWVGELYLEYHRGTYTSMAKNKRYNRKSEFLLQNAETLSLIGKHLLGYEYPKQELYDSWEKLLLNQFHDILPGTAIKEVYDVTDKEYESLTAENTQLTDKLISSLADKVAKKGIFVYNPTGFERSDVVSFNDALIYVENIPAYGWRVIGEPEIKKSDMIISEHHIENRFFIIDIDDCGNLIRVYDRLNDREVIKKGERANVLRAYDDHPRAWDNWEITMYYKEQMWEVNDVISIEVTENEFTSGAVRIKKKFLDSTLVQKIRVYRDVARIDFENEIDWHENHILLKTEFPVDIHSEKATYEIQYGAIERPTHSNTSWDAAKFEVCGHKWADLSEAGYGAAILNDCKYGYDIHDGVMSLTLIKCGTHPNPEADKCMHRFTYSFMPHNGHWREADVVRGAYYLNCPLKAIETTGKGTLPAEFSFISSDCENVIISAVKEACDNGDIIVRIYEAYGKRTKAVIKIGFEADSVFDINFIETENYSEIDLKVNEFELTFKPYEIKTIRIKL